MDGDCEVCFSYVNHLAIIYLIAISDGVISGKHKVRYRIAGYFGVHFRIFLTVEHHLKTQ